MTKKVCEVFMYKKDLVSIIIPFHNGERYVERCLKCLENQIYKNYEAIFVDDGSNDKTGEIIRKCSMPKIRLISIPKSGVSVARNVGIQNALGEYITFWDIDDIPHPDFVSTFIEDICRYGVDTVICNYDDVYAGNRHVKILLPWENQVITGADIEDVLIPRMIYPLKNEKAIRGLVWRTFTHTEILQKNKLFFDPDISMAEDLLFTMELYILSENIYVEDKSLYDYMRNSISTMNSYFQNQIESQLIFHERFANKLKKLNIYEKNQNRYEGNRLGMYSVCISNCSRNQNNQKETLKELIRLRKLLLNDNIKILHSEAPVKIKITCYLLILKMYRLLIVIYTLKEKIRISNYN